MVLDKTFCSHLRWKCLQISTFPRSQKIYLIRESTLKNITFFLEIENNNILDLIDETNLHCDIIKTLSNNKKIFSSFVF